MLPVHDCPCKLDRLSATQKRNSVDFADTIACSVPVTRIIYRLYTYHIYEMLIMLRDSDGTYRAEAHGFRSVFLRISGESCSDTGAVWCMSVEV